MKKTILFICLLLTAGTFTLAQSFLDSTFGIAGRFTHDFSTSSYARLQSTALLPDGKILAVGETIDSSRRAAALRCNADGTLDTTYGNQGEWISDDPNFVIASDVVIQPDGKALLAGYNYGSFVVVRLLPEGIYDPTFGVAGKSHFSVWPGTDLTHLNDLLLQPDGKILVCGHSVDNEEEGMMARLNPNGTLDFPFGTFGRVRIKPDIFNADWVNISRIGLCTNGQILASGFYTDFGHPSGGYVLRYQGNGEQDTTFGDKGIARIPRMGPVVGIYVLPTNNFSILCGIYDTIANKGTTTLVNWKSDGTLNTSLGNNGYTAFPVGVGNNPRNGFLQSDGKVLVFGNWHPGKGFLGRVNEDGSIDNTLGVNGMLISNEYYADGFVQPDGKIVTAGPYVFGGPMEKASILRYLGSNSVGAIEAPSTISDALIYPNPIYDQTLSIAYELPDASLIMVELLDLQGKNLGILLNTERSAGKNQETISLPVDLNTGFYILNIRTKRGNAMVKLSVMQP